MAVIIVSIIIAIVGIVAAFGAARYGAWLQKKWTPDPIPAIKSVEMRVNELRQRVDEIEQERAENETFTLGIRLGQASFGNCYVIEVQNDTDKDVRVESVQFFLGETALSAPDAPKPTDNWIIPAHRRKQLSWTPNHDPVGTLRQAGEPQGFTKTYCIVLGCRVDGKTRIAKRNLLLAFNNDSLMQYGP